MNDRDSQSFGKSVNLVPVDGRMARQGTQILYMVPRGLISVTLVFSVPLTAVVVLCGRSDCTVIGHHAANLPSG